jgi:hypothetical protein
MIAKKMFPQGTWAFFHGKFIVPWGNCIFTPWNNHVLGEEFKFPWGTT